MNIKIRLAGLAVVVLVVSIPKSFGQGNSNPTGVAGDFNGSITTAGYYDPYTGNAKRVVNDITVPGCVSDYPLKWTRTSISRTINAPPAHFGQGGPWIHSYRWRVDSVLVFYSPDGATIPFTEVMGLPDSEFVPGVYAPDSTTTGLPYFLEVVTANVNSRYMSDYNLLLPDGGKVVFQGGMLKKLVDPHGLETIFTTVNGADRITEPGGRYLQLNYVTLSWGAFVLGSVQAFDGLGHVTQTVTYNYTRIGTTSSSLLTRVDYDDGTSATYTYWPPGDFKGNKLKSCDDVRFDGPMKKIYYEYTNGTFSPGAACIYRERYSATGPIVSQLTYNSDTVRTETRADGKTRTFTYLNGYGELGNLTDFKGKTTAFTYVYYRTSVTDARGNRTDMVPNDVGLNTQVQYPLTPNDTPAGTPRGEVHNVYGSNSGGVECHLMSTRDEGGNTTTFTRDTLNRVTRIGYPDDSYETFENYNSFNQFQTHRLKTGGTETFAYDARGLKTEYRDPDHASGNPTARYAYDALDRVKDVTDALGSTVGDAAHTTSFTYNQRGQVLTTTKPIDPVDGQRHTITNVYNPDGTLASTTDELGHTTSYTYDDYKRIRSVTTPQRFTGDSTPRTTYTYYDANGTGEDYTRTTANPTFVVLPGGEKTKATYDENRRKLSVTVGYGTTSAATTSYVYDDVGNLIEARLPKQQTGQPYAGQKTLTTYDERNRAYLVTDPLVRTTRTDFDAAGRKWKVTRPNTQVVTYDSYDEMNRVLQQTVTQDPTPVAITKFTYYTGSETGAGLLKTMQDPRLVATSSSYAYTYTYDNMGRQRQLQYPPDSGGTQRTESWEYDLVRGLLHKFTNRAGKIQTSEYDPLNRLDTVSWDDGTPTVSYDYDVASRKTSVTNDNATVSYTYFNDNLLNTETTTYADSTARTVTYTYDANAKPKTLQYPGGVYQFNYSYTPRLQLQTVVNNAGGATIGSYVYDLNGNLTTRTPDNSTISTYTYDGIDRTLTIAHAFASSNTRTFSYGYELDTNNRKWTKRDNNKGDVFGYDKNDEVNATQLDILNPETTAPGNPKIVYDANGNQTSFAAFDQTNLKYGSTDTYTTNDLNQYASRTASTTPGYDEKGNTTTALDGSAATYDAQNRVLSVTKGTSSETYKYDGLNRQVSRVLSNVEGSLRYNVYDGWNLIAEYAPGGTTPTTSYVYGATGLIKRISGSTSIYYYHDASGSTSHLANSSGTLLEWVRYDLQGTPLFYNSSDQFLLTGSTVDNRFLFTGQQWYSSVGVYDLRNRFYSPDVGRFLQADPIGFKGDATNLYRYCGNNPIMRSDPTGEDAVPNGDGRYYFIMRPDLSVQNLAGSHVTHPNRNYSGQCAQGAQFLAGTANGKTYDAPDTGTWRQGPPVGSSTKVGTLIAKGWVDGRYLSKAADDYKPGENINHAGIYQGPGKERGTILVFDQFEGAVLKVRPAKPSDWSVVISKEQHAKNQSLSTPAAIRPPAQTSASGSLGSPNMASMSLQQYNWTIAGGRGPAGYSPAQGAEATNDGHAHGNPQMLLIEPPQGDFAWGNWDPDSPYPTGPVGSAMYGNWWR